LYLLACCHGMDPTSHIAIANTGCMAHILTIKNTPVHNKHVAAHPITIQKPNCSLSWSHHSSPFQQAAFAMPAVNLPSPPPKSVFYTKITLFCRKHACHTCNCGSSTYGNLYMHQQTNTTLPLDTILLLTWWLLHMLPFSAQHSPPYRLHSDGSMSLSLPVSHSWLMCFPSVSMTIYNKATWIRATAISNLSNTAQTNRFTDCYPEAPANGHKTHACFAAIIEPLGQIWTIQKGKFPMLYSI